MTKVKYLKNYPFSNEFQKHLNEASIVPAKGIENLELNSDSDLHATLRNILLVFRQYLMNHTEAIRYNQKYRDIHSIVSLHISYV